jgi:hypothetical protein
VTSLSSSGTDSCVLPAVCADLAARATTSVHPAPSTRPRYRRTGKDRELRDYVWWSAQDTADYADSMLAEALRQLHSGELSEEYAPSEKDLVWARRALDGSSPGEGA